MNNSHKRVYDPLYGVTKLSEEEYEILSAPEIQRLRYVRLCNINSMLITGASEISRFEHVVGVLRLAKEWCEHRGKKRTKQEHLNICAAAFLHDFQTGPFGHSLQYVLEDNETEEEFIHDDLNHGTLSKYHQSIDINASFCGRPFRMANLLSSQWSSITGLIKGDGDLGPLISGTLDLDNLDNVVRLAYHVGVADKSDACIALELARDMNAKEGILEISRASIPLVERWQGIRKRLYELLLLDWAEFSAKAMLTKAMELSVKHDLIGTDSWIKTDLELFGHLEKVSVGDAQEVGEIIKRIRCGELYEPIFIGATQKISIYKEFSTLETKIMLEEKLKQKLSDLLALNIDLIIHPILDSKKTERAISVKVRESGKVEIIGKHSNKLLLGVFVPREIGGTPKFNETLKRVVKVTLEGFGAKNIQEIEDPISESENVQLEFL
ncbi:HD domain-containing protein [Pseudoalteromonas sp. MEBiC 03485]|uniref:HD domain-containing protein n=1 Tax=Pseudoalteromonas sp. MEBiC 03485 TaxID=2571103 RepID=UPI00102173A3|nr:HD domain-containing protein [Pseudoalteromonas sp. MEBiC 03485]RZD20794.1 HD domain-containing protein [Pseudoalteromonas sp. MEBiC 03485]